MHIPIFVHSLFRSGSTYLFNVFRQKSNSYYCYQEPDHEVIDHVNNDPDELLNFNNKSMNALRHPNLDKSYFYELYTFRNQLKGLFDTSISFEGFFPKTSTLPANQKKYFSALINLAPSQPVLQLCRSYGRIKQLKNTFSGTHIHLWREPRSQWWSYLVDPYFEYTFVKILAAKNLPAIFNHLIKQEQVTMVNTFEQKYYRFFFFWTYAYIQNLKYSDIDLSIDMLSIDDDYKKSIIDQLSHHLIMGIKLDDCCSPYTHLSSKEAATYNKIEEDVLDVFANFNPEFYSYASKIKARLSELRKKLDHPESVPLEEKKYRSVALSFINNSAEANNLYLKQRNINEQQSMQANTEHLLLTLQIKEMKTTFDEKLKSKALKLNNTIKELSNAKHQLSLSENHLSIVKIQLLETTDALSLASQQIAETKAALNRANQRIAEIHESSSWKLSKPLRLIGDLVKSQNCSSENATYFFSNGQSWLKAKLKKRLKRVGEAALNNTWVKNKALGYLYSRPALKAKLRFLILAQNFSSPSTITAAPPVDKNAIELELSTPALLVKKQNQNAINANHKTPLESYYY